MIIAEITRSLILSSKVSVDGEQNIVYDEVGLNEDVLMKALDKIDELMRESKFELMLL